LPSSYWIDKLGFITEGKTCCYIHQTLLLGFPNWPVIYFTIKHNQVFWHHHHCATTKFFWRRCQETQKNNLPRQLGTIKQQAALAAVVTPVLEIMPELQGLCASPVLPLSEEHVIVDSLTALSSPERSDVISATIPPDEVLPW
jgi:hypothetical protein